MEEKTQYENTLYNYVINQFGKKKDCCSGSQSDFSFVCLLLLNRQSKSRQRKRSEGKKDF